MIDSILLGVGETFHLKRGKDRILYAGMPSEDVYSIVQRKENGNHGFAWNLYFSTRKTGITVDGVPLIVERVTPDEIQFRVQ